MNQIVINNDNQELPRMKLIEVPGGECFIHNNTLYLKITYQDKYSSLVLSGYNSINLHTGVLTYLPLDEMVDVVKSTITVTWR